MATATQTVSFEMVIFFHHIKREGESTVRIQCDTFEEMLERYRKERRRRRLADRATSGRYRMVLTDLGRERVAECEYAARSHADAIDGIWYCMDRSGVRYSSEYAPFSEEVEALREAR